MVTDIDKAIEYFADVIIALDKIAVMDEIIEGYTMKIHADLMRRKRHFELAIQALEKQLLKPLEHKVHEKYKALGKNYYCSCGVMFVDWENQPTNYCGKCGQKLKEDCIRYE